MVNVLREPIVLVAIIGALSAIIGGALTALVTAKRDEAAAQLEEVKAANANALAALTLLVQTQGERISKLELHQQTLEKSLADEKEGHNKELKKRRILEEKYSAACEWILVVHTAWEGLKIRLANVGFEHREIPRLPSIVMVDISTTEPNTTSDV